MPRAWMYAHSNIRFIRLAMPRAWMFAHRGPHSRTLPKPRLAMPRGPVRDPQTCTTHYPRLVPPPQADVSTDRPLQAMSQGLRTEAVPGVQGTGPGFFSGRSRARKRRGFSATEPLAISSTVPLAISPTVHTVPLQISEPFGISATGPPPAKRAPPVSRAALSAAQNPSEHQAARMMGVFPCGGAGPGAGCSRGASSGPYSTAQAAGFSSGSFRCSPRGGDLSGLGHIPHART